MTTAQEYARANANRFREELKELIRIPSISTDPAYTEAVNRAAQWLVDHLNNIGMTAEFIPTQRNPLVYAEMTKKENAKTVLVYGHYDVQPAAITDGWDTDPFDPVEKDGKIYARGANDNKGQFFAQVKAIESMLASDEGSPVNLKFIIEGEEESGGQSIAQYVNQNPGKLTADVCVISDTGMKHITQPAIVYSLRGMLGMELRITGPDHDLHSGAYGGTVHNPLQALAEIIAKLHTEQGSVAIPGFYDDVLELSPEERAELAKTPWLESEWEQETGAPQPWGEQQYTLLERRGARPTLEINGLAGGYAGTGFKTVLPASALAKISCRLVANQTPQKTYERIRDYIQKITPPTVHAELQYLHGGLPALVDIKHPAMQAAIRAYENGWGATPVFKREGGSIPIVADFINLLNLPVVMMGFGLSSDNIHGPNEHFHISTFFKGIDTAIHFFHEYAKLP